MNIFEFAMKMELDGKAYYEKLAGETNVSGLRNIFSSLAVDEQKHYETLLALQSQAQSTAMEDSTVLETARNVFEGLIDEKETLGTIRGDLDGYRYAMKLEVDSFQLYRDAATIEKNEDVKHLLQRIAGEEKNHYIILQNIFDFVNAPAQYLAWGEFSNIDEFHQFGREVDL